MPKCLKGSISAACCLADLRLIGAKFVNYNNCILSNVITHDLPCFLPLYLYTGSLGSNIGDGEGLGMKLIPRMYETKGLGLRLHVILHLTVSLHMTYNVFFLITQTGKFFTKYDEELAKSFSVYCGISIHQVNWTN